MTNNDVLRRMRYIFDLSDSKVIETFAHAQVDVNREQISQWLKKDDDSDFKHCKDIELAAFLNGFIIVKRGKKEGVEVVNETRLNNNGILRKLKIAMNLQGEGVENLFIKAGYPISKHEITAFFRKEGHKNYRLCKDQVLRYFLQGLQKDIRPKETEFSWDDAKPNSDK
mgnify:CR=1 FL=1